MLAFADAIDFMLTPRFLTLTLLKTGNESTGYYGTVARLRRLWGMRKALFKELKRRGYRIYGWVAVIEPANHMHLVLDCPDFIPNDEISKIWKTITKDSYIVKIKNPKYSDRGREILSERDLKSYLAKYLSKASSWGGFVDPSQFSEQKHFDGWVPLEIPIRINLEQLHGFKLTNSWAVWRMVKTAPNCENCYTFQPFRRIDERAYEVLIRYEDEVLRAEYEDEIARALDRIKNIHHVPC